MGSPGSVSEAVANRVSTAGSVRADAVADLPEQLTGPVEVLFGTQCGGGTDLDKAIAYSQSLIDRLRDSIFVPPPGWVVGLNLCTARVENPGEAVRRKGTCTLERGAGLCALTV